MLNEGKTITEIATIRGVLIRTVEDNIIKLIQNKVTLDWKHINGPDKNTIERVLECAKNWNDNKLRTLKLNLPDISYYHIKLALSRR